MRTLRALEPGARSQKPQRPGVPRGSSAPASLEAHAFMTMSRSRQRDGERDADPGEWWARGDEWNSGEWRAWGDEWNRDRHEDGHDQGDHELHQLRARCEAQRYELEKLEEAAGGLRTQCDRLSQGEEHWKDG